jgi:hypothetical protein
MTQENNSQPGNSLEQAAADAISEGSQEVSAEEGSEESSEGQVIEAGSEEGSEESSEGSLSKDFEDGINEASGKKEAKDSKEDKKEVKKADKAADKVGAKKVAADKYTIKVDGETLELSKEEMIRYAQMGKSGQKKMQEAAELQKRVNTFIELLKSDPAAILSDPSIGIDPVKFAQEVLAKQLEEESKSPEQREQEQLKAELEALRKEKQTAEERRKQEAQEQKMKQYENEISDKIIKIMEVGKLPNTPRYLRTVADIMLTAVENNLNITPEAAARIARDEVISDNKKLYENMSDEELEDFLGQEVIKRVRKNSIKKVVPAKVAPQVKTASTGETTPKVEQAPQKKSLKDFQKFW